MHIYEHLNAYLPVFSAEVHGLTSPKCPGYNYY